MVSTDVVVYRPTFGRVLFGCVTVLAVGGLIAGLVQNFDAALVTIAPIALVVLFVWAAYWRPAVVVSPGGVELCNVTRTIELPWPSIQRIDTKYALTLVTAYGEYASWAAPAPGRRAHLMKSDPEATKNLPKSTINAGTVGSGDLGNTSSGQAAFLIRHRWEELRDAGLLKDAKLERNRPVVRWHTATLIAMGVLLGASIVGFAV